MLNQTHLFVPPSHPGFHYVGRWIPSANHLRYEAAFPGSYVEFTVTNTTSVHLVLNNVYGYDPSSDDDADEEESRAGHLVLQSAGDYSNPPGSISLLVEIGDDATLLVESGASMLRIAQDLVPQKEYTFRVTHLGHAASWREETCEFEGLWLDRPASLTVKSTLSINSTVNATLDTLDSFTDGHSQQGHPAPARKKPVIELVTSEYPGFLGDENPLDLDTIELVTARVSGWYTLLEEALSADVVLIPTGERQLTQEPKLSDLFFRSGPCGSSLWSRPWSFTTYQPTALILQLGNADFVDFFYEKENANKHALAGFTNEFVDKCVNFIRSIRSNAYPLQSAAKEEDGSYIYNSAPSTLPIFLLPPFSSRRWYVTRKLTLHKIISDALAEVAAALKAEGDKSTHWIDTTGWLDPKEDFEPEWNYNRRNGPHPLTIEADGDMANFLADHICPFIERAAATDSSGGGALGDCAFDSYDSYLGNVYLPKDMAFERTVLERKIQAIKNKIKWPGHMGLEGVAEWITPLSTTNT